MGALRTQRGSERITLRRRADLWEREMAGVVEALRALRQRLEGVSWEDKRYIVGQLVKGIVVETVDGGPVVHVTYRFERPTAEIAVPIEVEPLFSGEGARQIGAGSQAPAVEPGRPCVPAGVLRARVRAP